MPEEPATTPTSAAAAPAAVSPATAREPGAAHKIKTRKPRQRACDEKDAKGKLCAGHLKRFFELSPELERLVGKGAEVYRCEFCKTIYRPDPKQLPNSYTVRY